MRPVGTNINENWFDGNNYFQDEILYAIHTNIYYDQYWKILCIVFRNTSAFSESHMYNPHQNLTCFIFYTSSSSNDMQNH